MTVFTLKYTLKQHPNPRRTIPGNQLETIMNSLGHRIEQLDSLSDTGTAERNSAVVLAFPDMRRATQSGKSIVRTWIDRHRNRKALRELDEFTLRDVGLDTPQIHAEMNKPFWKA